MTRRRTIRWATHLAGDTDPVVVDRLMQGESVPEATAWERREAVLALHHQGYSQMFISRRVRIHPKQVFRDLARANLVKSGSKGGKVMPIGYRSPGPRRPGLP